MSQGSHDRLLGVALFLFIPLTLWLMLRLPLGQGKSLALAACIIALHRPIARRLMLARAGRRCLWCGGPCPDPAEVRLAGAPPFRACSHHLDSLKRFLSYVADRAIWLRLSILGTVAGYFLLGALASLGIEPVSLPLRRLAFRLLIALSVVSVALLYRNAPARAPDAFPFPIHNLALLGVRLTLRVFLLVGAFWTLLSAWALGMLVRGQPLP